MLYVNNSEDKAVKKNEVEVILTKIQETRAWKMRKLLSPSNYLRSNS